MTLDNFSRWACSRCLKADMTRQEFDLHVEIHNIIESDLRRLKVKFDTSQYYYERLPTQTIQKESPRE